MTTLVALRVVADDAHAAFVRHDAHCAVCREAGRYGSAWKQHLCPRGSQLYQADEDASRTYEAARYRP